VQKAGRDYAHAEACQVGHGALTVEAWGLLNPITYGIEPGLSSASLASFGGVLSDAKALVWECCLAVHTLTVFM